MSFCYYCHLNFAIDRGHKQAFARESQDLHEQKVCSVGPTSEAYRWQGWESKQRSLQCSVGLFDQKQLREERAYLVDSYAPASREVGAGTQPQRPQGETEEEPVEEVKKSSWRNTADWLTQLCFLYNPGTSHFSQWTRPSPIHHQSRKRLLHKLTAQPNGVNSLTKFSTLSSSGPQCVPSWQKLPAHSLRHSWLSPECTCPVSDCLTTGSLCSVPLLWDCCLESADSRHGWVEREGLVRHLPISSVSQVYAVGVTEQAVAVTTS